MTSSRRFILTLAMVSLVSASALAHGTGRHERGTVSATTADTITLKTAEGPEVTLLVTAKTQFLKSGAKASLADLKPGIRVIADVEEKDGKLHATLVRFGPPKKTASAPSH